MEGYNDIISKLMNPIYFWNSATKNLSAGQRKILIFLLIALVLFCVYSIYKGVRQQSIMTKRSEKRNRRRLAKRAEQRARKYR